MLLQSVVILVGIILSVSAGPSDPELQNRDQMPWWQETHQRNANNTISPTQQSRLSSTEIGDVTITQGWGGNGRPVFEALYQPLGTANYGISGDRTEHVLWRILNGEVQGLSPKLVVLKIGTNNLGAHDNVAIAGGVSTIVSTLRQLLPNTKVLLLGILPRNGAGNYERIIEINRSLRDLHNGAYVFFLDMFGSFTESWGTVPVEFFYDGLHLTTAGYQKWADTMGPLFNQLIV